jgi:predicted SnoaL-like aldol condensation-catalyzing enzyme
MNVKHLVVIGIVALWAAVPAYAEEAANLQLAKSWVKDIVAVKTPAEVRAIVEQYMSSDYVQHSNRFPPGRAGIIEVLSKAVAAGIPLKPANLIHRSFVAKDDFVMWIDENEDPAKPSTHSFMFEIFHVKDGKFVEHWETGS